MDESLSTRLLDYGIEASNAKLNLNLNLNSTGCKSATTKIHKHIRELEFENHPTALAWGQLT